MRHIRFGSPQGARWGVLEGDRVLNDRRVQAGSTRDFIFSMAA